MSHALLNSPEYQAVLEQVEANLAAGVGPWGKDWTGGGVGSVPQNHTTGIAYKGINVLILMMSQAKAGHSHSLWATYKQWQDAGHQVTKGEVGTRCVRWVMFSSKAEKAAAKKEKRKPKLDVFQPKWFSVFNISQTDAPLPEVETVDVKTLVIPRAEALIAASGADYRVVSGSDSAFYNPALDFVQMPSIGQFNTPEGYYRTALHELTHWTGHKSRLDRDQKGRFGSPDYAKEELIAEMGAAFLCNTIGLGYDTQHASYIKSWLKALQNDRKFLYDACKAASAAADFILELEDGAAEELKMAA